MQRKQPATEFPEHVIELKSNLALFAQDGSKDDIQEFEIMRLLTEPKEDVYLSDYVNMWKTFRRNMHDPCDTMWASCFIEQVKNAYHLPPYYYLNNKERAALIDRINSLSNNLKNILKTNELETQLVSIEGKIFNGMYIFEEFGEKNQALMTEDDCHKAYLSGIMDLMLGNACERISEANTSGKKAKNIEAIRFIRLMSEHNIKYYNNPLNSVIKTATFALYDIDYSDSDIHNIVNRNVRSAQTA